MKRIGMNVTGISETKWFGQEVYEIWGCTILHSGDQHPATGNQLSEGKELELY